MGVISCRHSRSESMLCVAGTNVVSSCTFTLTASTRNVYVTSVYITCHQQWLKKSQREHIHALCGAESQQVLHTF